MKQMLLLMVLALGGIACSDDRAPSDPETSRQTAQASPSPTGTPAESPPAADIYAAVVRQLASDKDLVRRAEVVYIVDGPVSEAGKPRGNPFGPAPEGFGSDVIAEIRNQVGDELPRLRFLDDGTKALRHPNRPGATKNGGVLISLGPIDPVERRVEVANTLWCGGKCSRWQTYVVSNRSGRWVVTGNRGPVVAS